MPCSSSAPSSSPNCLPPFDPSPTLADSEEMEGQRWPTMAASIRRNQAAPSQAARVKRGKRKGRTRKLKHPTTRGHLSSKTAGALRGEPPETVSPGSGPRQERRLGGDCFQAGGLLPVCHRPC